MSSSESLPYGWIVKDQKLFKKFEFPDFIQAFSFLTSIALEAEKVQHHPEWTQRFHIVEINLYTHDSNGITEKDYSLAETINSYYKIKNSQGS